MADDPWFKPKTHGYGAHPLDWRGWAAIAVFCLLATVWSLAIVFSGLAPLTAMVLMCVGLAIMITIFAIWAKKKTNGPWRWRWGKNGEKA